MTACLLRILGTGPIAKKGGLGDHILEWLALVHPHLEFRISFLKLSKLSSLELFLFGDDRGTSRIVLDLLVTDRLGSCILCIGSKVLVKQRLLDVPALRADVSLMILDVLGADDALRPDRLLILLRIQNGLVPGKLQFSIS